MLTIEIGDNLAIVLVMATIWGGVVLMTWVNRRR